MNTLQEYEDWFAELTNEANGVSKTLARADYRRALSKLSERANDFYHENACHTEPDYQRRITVFLSFDNHLKLLIRTQHSSSMPSLQFFHLPVLSERIDPRSPRPGQ
ncbi:hypothetical protein [Legionella sp. CNM-4043-24]|uniref:hypothetical protein n=1 Tax=Legionella sp. CNM-4043-24 TaxID=3421646 RepID=UPI00403A86F4